MASRFIKIDLDSPPTLATLRIIYIHRLIRHYGTISAAATMMGVDRRTLQRHFSLLRTPIKARKKRVPGVGNGKAKAQKKHNLSKGSPRRGRSKL